MSVGLAIAWVVLGAYDSIQSIQLFLHSDLQYLPALFDDLASGGRLDQWALTHSGYLFPDLLIYSAARVVSSSAHWTFIAVAIALPIATAALLRVLASRLVAPNAGVQTVALFSLLLIGMRPGGLDFPTPLVALSDHGGQALVAVACMCLLLQASPRRIAVASLLSLLTSASNPLFVITSLPALLWLTFRTHQGRTRVLGLIGLVSACGLGIYLHGLLPIPPQQPLIVPGRSSDALRIFLSRATVAESAPVVVSLLVGLLALFVARERNGRTLVVTAWLTVLSSLFGLWLIGAEVGIWKSRYFVSFWLALTLLVPCGLQVIKWQRAVTTLAVVATILLGLWRVIPLLPNVRKIGQLKPEPVTCFERAAKRAPLARCVATYWNAKPVAVMADSKPVVLQIRADGVPDWWINTRRHDREGLPIDCAILDQGRPTTSSDASGSRTTGSLVG
ncbi:MAG: hypothetical protein AB1938_09075 [Myxococcota bacterium]